MPSEPKRSAFIDALEGKSDIRAVWRDTINSTCKNFTSPAECKVDFFKAESKLDVLMWGWNTCSTPYLKANNFQLRDSMRDALEKNFAGDGGKPKRIAACAGSQPRLSRLGQAAPLQSGSIAGAKMHLAASPDC